MSRSSDIVSQIHKRRADRKKPKVNAKLKKVSIAENQIGGLATASENKPPPITVQKTGGRNSLALTFSVGFHVLIAVVFGIIVIKDQIATGEEEFGAALLPQAPRQQKRVNVNKRPDINFKAKNDVVETPVQRTPITNAKIPNPTGGPTLPTTHDTDLTPVGPSLNPGPKLTGLGKGLNRPIQSVQPNIKPEINRPTNQGGPIVDLDIPPPADGSGGLEVPDIDPSQQQGMTPPQPKKEVKPIYPKNAERAQKVGKVILQATIGIDGIPKDIVKITNLGFGLEEAAIAALKKTRYIPAKKNGKAVELRVNIPFEFKFED